MTNNKKSISFSKENSLKKQKQRLESALLKKDINPNELFKNSQNTNQLFQSYYQLLDANENKKYFFALSSFLTQDKSAKLFEFLEKKEDILKNNFYQKASKGLIHLFIEDEKKYQKLKSIYQTKAIFTLDIKNNSNKDNLLTTPSALNKISDVQYLNLLKLKAKGSIDFFLTNTLKTSELEELLKESDFLAELKTKKEEYKTFLKQFNHVASAKIHEILLKEKLTILKQKELNKIKVQLQNLLEKPLAKKNILSIDIDEITGLKCMVFDKTYQIQETKTYFYLSENQEKLATNLLNLITTKKIELIVINSKDALFRDTINIFFNELIAKNNLSVFKIILYKNLDFPITEQAKDEFSFGDTNSVYLKCFKNALYMQNKIYFALSLVNLKNLISSNNFNILEQYEIDNACQESLNKAIKNKGVNLENSKNILLEKFFSKDILEKISKKKVSSIQDLKNELEDNLFLDIADFCYFTQNKNLLENIYLKKDEQEKLEKKLENTDVNLNDFSLGLFLKNYPWNQNQDIKDIYKKINLLRNNFALELPRFSYNLNLQNLSLGDILDGMIINIASFGAFVDINININCLLHISNTVVGSKTMFNLLKQEQTIRVKVIKIDIEKKQVNLELLPKPKNMQKSQRPKSVKSSKAFQKPLQNRSNQIANNPFFDALKGLKN